MSEFLVPECGPKGGGLLHQPREIWCCVGHSGLGYPCGLLLPYLRALRPIMVTWLDGCAPPDGEGREGLLAEFVVLERVFGDPPGVEESGNMAVLWFGPFMPPQGREDEETGRLSWAGVFINCMTPP